MESKIRKTLVNVYSLVLSIFVCFIVGVALSKISDKVDMQALENFDAMKDLNQQFQKEYGEDGEVIWIIGLQDKTGKSMNSNPRHLVKDIIIQ